VRDTRTVFSTATETYHCVRVLTRPPFHWKGDPSGTAGCPPILLKVLQTPLYTSSARRSAVSQSSEEHDLSRPDRRINPDATHPPSSWISRTSYAIDALKGVQHVMFLRPCQKVLSESYTSSIQDSPLPVQPQQSQERGTFAGSEW